MVDLLTSLIVAGTLGLALGASFLVLWSIQKYLAEYVKRTKTKIDDVILSFLKGPVLLLIIAYGVILLVRAIAEGYPGQTTSGLSDSLNLASVFTLVLVGTWAAAKLVVILSRGYLEKLALKTQSRVDDVAVGVFGRLGRILILIAGIAIALGFLWMAIGLLGIAAGQ